jgi:multisubunit Na+/H+ antiporter MnhB subunit
MSRTTLIGWVIAAIGVIVVVVAFAAQPTHYKRTAAVGVVVAVIGALVALLAPRKPSEPGETA